MEKMIDAHIHLDRYGAEEISGMVENLLFLEAMVTVSFDLASSEKNLQLARKYDKVKPAFGFHPEQPLPGEKQFETLLNWMSDYKDEMIAVGEVGLPYYLRKEQGLSPYQSGQYLELLEQFIKLAKQWGKPVALHAVYDDAPIVCDLLEKYSLTKAHFHWFKGDSKTIDRMIGNGYFVSITPDILYEPEIQELAGSYPLGQMMIETDGPWPFEGPFKGKRTHPGMMAESVKQLAAIKKIPETDVSRILLENTKKLYRLS
ncbi:TatD family hydrolase [Bacillus sp. CECT 9360]|uniref:TatD family hydrolase n=1 Tax=Bacillus sp. CECT 9360 TaxID=2845821 RepID=UPI001E2B2826|nr:TatD family hydrolase [Bacillus sp. CECT 9360]CAH0344281.1 putative metal-dependent hydrolase YcfH [Bacillus sp. CECT 9360]